MPNEHRVQITSLHNPRVKETERLRDRRDRERRGATLIDGARELMRAIDAGVAIDEAFACPELCSSDECRAALARLQQTGVAPWEVSAAVMQKMAFGDRGEGLLAVARPPHRRPTELSLPGDPFVAVLEGVQKPGNLGAVIRSADAAGVSALLLAAPETDLYNPNAIRASLGTIFSVPIGVASTDDTIGWLRERGLRIMAARVDGDLTYLDSDLTGPLAIVFGSEARGLTEAWSGPDVVPVRVPMLGVADSLNVSATAAILFYEALRQRTLSKRSTD